MNRAKRIVKIAEKLSCGLGQASRLYGKAEKENKLRVLREKTGAW